MTTVAFSEPEVEVVLFGSDDVGVEPSRFCRNGRQIPFVTGYLWVNIWDEPNSPPVHYLRSFTHDSLRSGGIIRPGSDVISPHRVVEINERLAKNGSPLIFRVVAGDPEGWTDDPVTYEWSADNPEVLFRFSSRFARVKEADVLDWKLEFLPGGLVINPNGLMGVPYMQQHAVITGTYDGRTVNCLGAWDKMFGGSAMNVSYGQLFAGVAFSGIRADGRREWGDAMIFGDKSAAYFCRDGQEPIASSEVELVDAVWERLDYLGDGTATLRSGTFRFGGIEIHYQGSHGYRGWDDESILSLRKSGYSMSTGHWHEGGTPYEHSTSFSFAEFHEAFIHALG